MIATSRFDDNGISPPSDLEAERAVLCAVFLDGEALERVAPLLPAGDFYRTAHRHIYEAMLSLRDRGEPILAGSVAARLRDTGLLDRVGGVPYVSDLAGVVNSPSHVEYFVGLVRDSARRRDLLQCGSRIRDLAELGGVPINELVANAQAQLALLEATVPGGRRDVLSVITCRDLLTDASAAVEWVWKGYVARSETTVLGSPPKRQGGKSTLLFALCQAIEQGSPLMKRVRVALKTLAADGWVTTTEPDHTGIVCRGFDANPAAPGYACVVHPIPDDHVVIEVGAGLGDEDGDAAAAVVVAAALERAGLRVEVHVSQTGRDLTARLPEGGAA